MEDTEDYNIISSDSRLNKHSKQSVRGLRNTEPIENRMTGCSKKSSIKGFLYSSGYEYSRTFFM